MEITVVGMGYRRSCGHGDIQFRQQAEYILGVSNPAYSWVCELVTDRPVLDLPGAARPATPADNYQGLSW